MADSTIFHNHDLGTGTPETVKKYIDFVGFQYGDKHSSDLNFVRTSDGNRYNETMIPSLQEKTQAVSGGDGTYYWDTFYTQRQIQLSIAFDSMTEANMREFKQTFNGKEVKDLIFDETPYKKFRAKVSGQPQLKYICFEEDEKRVYKGEGTINFICYDPYAHSTIRYLDNATGDRFENKDEWSGMTGMKNNYEDRTDGECYDKTYPGVSSLNGYRHLFNAGDVPMDLKIYFRCRKRDDLAHDLTLQLKDEEGKIISQLITHVPGVEEGKYEDPHFCINSKTNLITLVDKIKIGPEATDYTFIEQDELFNNYIVEGDFLKCPPGEHLLYWENSDEYMCQGIDYEFLYI